MLPERWTWIRAPVSFFFGFSSLSINGSLLFSRKFHRKSGIKFWSAVLGDCRFINFVSIFSFHHILSVKGIIYLEIAYYHYYYCLLYCLLEIIKLIIIETNY